MQTGKSKLIIHTTIAPDETAQETQRPAGRVKWRVLPHPLNRDKARPGASPKARASILPKARAQASHIAQKAPRMRHKRTAGEKLLRNTAIACALLMSVMAVSKIDQPWSRQISQAVSGAITMRVDLDETLGKLNFVRNWMPDSALVFWNMGAKDAWARPVSGALVHAYDAAQPWLEYQVNGQQPVYAASAGRVAALSENSECEWTLMLDHDNGLQTVYAYLGKPIVAQGQTVERGAQIALTQDQENARLYFELRSNGIPEDPSQRLGDS